MGTNIILLVFSGTSKTQSVNEHEPMAICCHFVYHFSFISSSQLCFGMFFIVFSHFVSSSHSTCKPIQRFVSTIFEQQIEWCHKWIVIQIDIKMRNINNLIRNTSDATIPNPKYQWRFSNVCCFHKCMKTSK